jgi:isopenicillin-N epimerase
VLFLSHITSPTAIILPIEELIARARKRGIITVIDGAHAPGQTDLNIDQIGADFYVGNCHKWMMAPKESGFLHVRREMQSIIELFIAGWGYESEKPGSSRLIDYVEWQGTRDISAFLSVPAAIKFMRNHSWDKVESSCHDLLRGFRQAMTDATDLPPITPDSRDWYAQIAAFPLPACDGEGLQTALYEQFHVELPITSWNDQSFIRVSVQAYNEQSDLEALIAGLKDLLPEYSRAGTRNDSER